MPKKVALGLIGCLAVEFFLLAPFCASADDFDILVERWAQYYTGGTNINLADPVIASRVSSIAAAASENWSSMNTNAGRTYLWSDLASTASESQIASAYGRLAEMALGWATTGSSLKGNSRLAEAIVSGLDWMYANRYNESITEFGNWWFWDIGSPLALNQTMVLIYPRLTGAQVTNYCNAIDHFNPSVSASAGANRVWRAEGIGVRGALGRNAAKVIHARDALSGVFTYVTSGEGFYSDGGFIQHGKHPYTGGYGNSLLRDLARLVDWFEPTQWVVTDPKRANVIRWCYDSYEPFLYCGSIAEHLRGREISRPYSTGDSAGHDAMNAMLRIARTAPAADALRLRSIVKHLDLADTTRSLESYVDIDLVGEASALMEDPGIPARGELIGHFQVPSIDRVMHLRPGFGLTLSMFSSRIYNYESINGENLHGWFTSHGMSYLLNTNDITQFTDSFWPTVDPYHLPGTTVDLTPLADSAGQTRNSTQHWVGGAGLGNELGSVGMSLDAVSGSLVAKKSWFMFDNEVVCLGAGISCSATTNVHTTVENRSLHTSNTRVLTIDGRAMANTLGWSTNIANVNWCALDGAGAYFFPGGAALRATRQTRTGSWADIGTGPGASISRNYVSLVLDHGVAPAGASYAYVLLPNFSAAAAAGYASSPQVSILANTAAVQAAREVTLGLTGANFWNASGGAVDFISCDKPASVFTRESGGVLEVAISDPTWTNTSAINLSLNRSGLSLLSADPGITVVSYAPRIQILVNVGGARGKSFQARFATLVEPILVANADAAVTGGGTPLLIDVLANDFSNTGTVTLLGVGTPSHGTANIVGGVARYVPAAGFSGADSFTYQVTDGTLTTNGTVSISVGGSVFSISPGQLSASSAQEGNPAVNVLDSNLSTRWSAQNLGGTNQWLQFDLLSTQSVRGVSIAFYNGSSRISYFNVLTSGDGTTWTQRLAQVASSGASTALEEFPMAPVWTRYVRIEGLGNSVSTWNSYTEARILAGTNAMPVPVNDYSATLSGSVVAINVLANDVDPDLGPQSLEITSFTQPAHGTVSRTNSLLFYRPAADFAGEDSFSYGVSDGGPAAWGFVSVTVTNLPAPRLSAKLLSGRDFELTVDGPGGRIYHVLGATSAHPDSVWSTLLVSNSVNMPLRWVDPVTNWARFYRVQVQ